MKIMNIYDPVGATKDNGCVKFEVTGRTYTLDENSVFPSSVISRGNELLAGPITVSASVCDKTCEFDPADHRLIVKQSDEFRTAVSSMETADLVVDVIHNVEFDGCDIINLNIAPRGITPGSVEVLVGRQWNTIFHLDYLYVDVPLNKNNINCFQAYPYGNWFDGYIGGKEETIKNEAAGIIPKGGLNADFKEQIYLYGSTCGIGFFFDSDEEWNYNDKNKVFEVIETESAYILRIHFYDAEPKQWKNKGRYDNNSRNVFPVSLKFGMMVTPIKPLTDEMPYEKNIHIDCMKRFPEPHDEFLSGPVVSGSDEIAYDRFKRMGVEVLYLHEKWNDIQNSVLLTEESSARLKTIVAECHKRGMKLVPYFGFEISTLSPLFHKYGKQQASILERQEERAGFWYRTPSQRALTLSMDSEWCELYYNGLKTIVDEYGIDGLYFDSTFLARESVNSLNGSGYTDENGHRHRTFNTFMIREFSKAIGKLASEKGLIVNFHPSGTLNLAVMGFCTSLFDGEFMQGDLIRGEIRALPLGCLRGIFDCRNTGIPVQGICYVNPPVWTFHEAVGMMLLHGCVPKTVCWEDGLEEMSQIWKVYDGFKCDGVKWKPYYDEGCPVTCADTDVKISCYEREDQILAIVVTANKDFEGTITLETKYTTAVDAFSGKTLVVDGLIKAALNGFDYRLILIDK